MGDVVLLLLYRLKKEYFPTTYYTDTLFFLALVFLIRIDEH